jgi:signal transduction histidine kinase
MRVNGVSGSTQAMGEEIAVERTRSVLDGILDGSRHEIYVSGIGFRKALLFITDAATPPARKIAGYLRGFMRHVADCASLSSRGVRVHFDIAIALTTIIPALALCYVAFGEPSESVKWMLLAPIIPLMGLGYYLVGRYPRALMQLRDYLQQVAAGHVPDMVRPIGEEKDLLAIQKYFNLILEDMKHKIMTIEEQKGKLIELERKEAMTASLAAACHHVGQPATILTGYLSLMKSQEASPPMHFMIHECEMATDRITDILRRFNQMTHFKAEPYITTASRREDGSARANERILAIDGI